MPRIPTGRNERTSKRASSAAARVLAGKGTRADAKTAAASALTQASNKRKKAKKKAKKKRSSK